MYSIYTSAFPSPQLVLLLNHHLHSVSSYTQLVVAIELSALVFLFVLLVCLRDPSVILHMSPADANRFHQSYSPHLVRGLILVTCSYIVTERMMDSPNVT